MVELTPEEKQKIYEEEKTRKEAQGKLKDEDVKKYISIYLFTIGLGLIGGIIGFFILGFIGGFIGVFVGGINGILVGGILHALGLSKLINKMEKPSSEKKHNPIAKKFAIILSILGGLLLIGTFVYLFLLMH